MPSAVQWHSLRDPKKGLLRGRVLLRKRRGLRRPLGPGGRFHMFLSPRLHRTAVQGKGGCVRQLLDLQKWGDLQFYYRGGIGVSVSRGLQRGRLRKRSVDSRWVSWAAQSLLPKKRQITK
jgi:hypothetical protein